MKKFKLLKILKHYWRSLISYFQFLVHFKRFKSLSGNNGRFEMKWSSRSVHLKDNTKETFFDRHYIYHPAWAVRVLKKTNPDKHVDISSTLYFCSIVSAFIPIDFYDYRPAELSLEGLSTKHADLTDLHFKDNEIKSLSCMHTVEHIGLGRYGDFIDPEGDLKAINELKRVLAKGGNLLFVVPIGGKAKIVYNAHRIYTYEQICDYFEGFKLEEFSLIPEGLEDGGIIKNPPKELLERQEYACGCFWFKK